MIRCPRCNTELPDGVSFCDACGAPVKGQMPQASPVYQPFGGAPVAAGPTTCPVCGTSVLPGEAFCDNCGASLVGPATLPGTPLPFGQPQPLSAAPPPFAQPLTPVAIPPFTASSPPAVTVAPTAAPRLVVISSRAELTLPARDDIVLGREDPQSNSFPDVDLNPHGGLEQGVSRRHARITRRDGQFFVEDLNSVNGTLLNQHRITANTPVPLRPGDHLMLGRLGLTFEA